MRMNATPSHTKVTDFALAAALKAYGFKLVNLEPAEGRRVAFVFQNDVGIDETTRLFWMNQLPIDALTYFAAVKLLKSQLHSLNR